MLDHARKLTKSGHLSSASKDSSAAARVPAACRKGRISDCSMAKQACLTYGASTCRAGAPRGDLAVKIILFFSTSAAVCRTCNVPEADWWRQQGSFKIGYSNNMLEKCHFQSWHLRRTPQTLPDEAEVPPQHQFVTKAPCNGKNNAQWHTTSE